MTLQPNEQLIILGTLHASQLNAAPADSQVTIELGNVFPDGKFPTHIIVKKTENFDSNLFASTLRIGDDVGQISGNIPKVMMPIPFGFSFANQNNNEPLFHAILSGGLPTCNGYGIAPVRVDLNFDLGNGEVNPKNFTKGSVVISVIVRDF